MTTAYLDLIEINENQERVMVFIQKWVAEQKVPVPHKEILNHMTNEGMNIFTVQNAVKCLVRKGYIRKAFAISNKTFYVMIRKLFS